MMSFSVTSTIRPRFAGIIASAACFAVMMREVRPCRKIASAFFRSACQRKPYCFISGSSPATLSTTMSMRLWARMMRRNSALTSRLVRVIDAHGDGRAAGGLDHRRGLVDRLGPPIRRRLAFDAAAGAVDRRAGFAERPCDAAAGAARRAGDEGDASGQRPRAPNPSSLSSSSSSSQSQLATKLNACLE